MSYTSPFPPLDIPKHDIFTHVLGGLTQDEASLPALTELTTDATVSYGELRERAESFAAALAARGIGKGDVVALQVPNSINFAVALLGIVRLGAVVSPIGVLMNQSDVDKLVALSGAKLYVGVNDIEGTPQIFEGEIHALSLPGRSAPEVSIDPEDLAAIPFSSGTTGMPKGVKLPHRALVSNIDQSVFMTRENGVTEPSNYLCPLPFSHIYGLTALLLANLSSRHHIHTMPKFDLATFIGAHPKHAIRFTYIAPPMAVALAKHPAVNAEDFSTTEFMLSGAAPLDSEVARAVENRLAVTMLQGYGMTETSPVTHITIKGKADPGSIGFAVPNTEFRFLELEGDADVAEGEVGELAIKGPQVMAGYLNNDEATREVMLGDGWIRTGDVARLAADGTTYIVDRAKEVIKYKGYQVAPAELEALLLTHPEIDDAGVVGVMRDGLEIPRAFVVKAEGSKLTERDVMQWVAERVTPYKKVRAVDFITEIPKNPTGKIERKKLREIPFNA